ncbi:MAG: PepSY domain-containing protein [Fimbriiglobus sp.]
MSTTTTSPLLASKPWGKRMMMAVRRLHLYLGLFLFPWAVLYGVTAFLFNHPTVWSDTPTQSFGPQDLRGTPLEAAPSPQAIAEQVLAKLNEMQKPSTPYTQAGPAKFGGRDFAFATIQAPGQTVSLLLDFKTSTGTLRSGPVREKKEAEKAPFAVGSQSAQPKGRNGRPRNDAPQETLTLDNSLAEQMKQSIPTVLERTGFPKGEVTVTSTPDVIFPIEANGRIWTAQFNPLTGSISGVAADVKPESDLSWRRFLLRLHTAHGYPGEANGRWFWAVIVDAMAFTMCFWGLSGLVMWWQLKATRKLGAIILIVSALTATLLALAMHNALTA